MPYQFQAEKLGSWRMMNRASGKDGFGLPKIFIIESMDQPALGQFTYCYVDTVTLGARTIRFSNAVLCRIAISRFLLAGLGAQRIPFPPIAGADTRSAPQHLHKMVPLLEVTGLTCGTGERTQPTPG
jgi:hypothetical protein